MKFDFLFISYSEIRNQHIFVQYAIILYATKSAPKHWRTNQPADIISKRILDYSISSKVINRLVYF